MATKIIFFHVAIFAFLLFSISPCEASTLTTIDMNTFITMDDVIISEGGNKAEYSKVGNSQEIVNLPYYTPPAPSSSSPNSIDEKLEYVALDFEQEMQTAAESSAIEKTYTQTFTFMTNNPSNSGPGISLGQGSNSVHFSYIFNSNWAFLSVVLYNPSELDLLAYKIITDPGEGTVNLNLPALDSLAGPIAMDFRVEDYLLGRYSYDTSNSFASVGIENLQIITENDFPPEPVPEPSTFLLLGGGLIGLAFAVRRRRKE